MKKLWVAALAAMVLVFSSGGQDVSPPIESENVRVVRVPDGGIQPQVVVDDNGTAHVVYYRGDPKQGDVFYSSSIDGGTTFSTGKRVNGQPGSSVALTTVRGPHISLGKGKLPHVAWAGSSKARPKGPLDPEMAAESPSNGVPMLYSQLNEPGADFQMQRNLMTRTFGLDGGGSVASDGSGNVYVVWHATTEDSVEGEEGRRVWLARSKDGGTTFSPEAPVSGVSQGVCVCCGVRALVSRNSTLFILYRSASGLVHRDTYLLVSTDNGASFQEKLLDKWTIGACPLSTMYLTEGPNGVIAAWESKDQVYYASINPKSLNFSDPAPAPGSGLRRKHPVVAANGRGEMILVWTEGTGLQKGRSLSWQVFDESGDPTGPRGNLDGVVPEWSFGTAFVRPDGGFTIIY